MYVYIYVYTNILLLELQSQYILQLQLNIQEVVNRKSKLHSHKCFMLTAYLNKADYSVILNN